MEKAVEHNFIFLLDQTHARSRRRQKKLREKQQKKIASLYVQKKDESDHLSVEIEC